MISHRRTRRHAVLSLVLLTLLIAGLVPAAAQSGTATSTPLPPGPAVTAEPNAFPGATTPQIELVGYVQAVTATTITVNGVVIQTAGAEMNAMPVVGAPVKVEGTILTTGQIAAREVRTVDLTRRGLRPGEIELVGLLTDNTQGRLIVAGLPMDATAAEFGRGVAVGQWVKVHAALNAQNQWIVREVELASDDDRTDFSGRPQGEFEITGTLSEVGADYIVINGQRISTNGAEIKGLLVPGALVKVHLSLVNGQWLAREVEPADRDDDRDFEDDDSRDDESRDDSRDDNSGSGSGSDDSGRDDRGDDRSDDSHDDSSDDRGDDSHDDSSDDSHDDDDDDDDDDGDDD